MKGHECNWVALALHGGNHMFIYCLFMVIGAGGSGGFAVLEACVNVIWFSFFFSSFCCHCHGGAYTCTYSVRSHT